MQHLQVRFLSMSTIRVCISCFMFYSHSLMFSVFNLLLYSSDVSHGRWWRWPNRWYSPKKRTKILNRDTSLRSGVTLNIWVRFLGDNSLKICAGYIEGQGLCQVPFFKVDWEWKRDAFMSPPLRYLKIRVNTQTDRTIHSHLGTLFWDWEILPNSNHFITRNWGLPMHIRRVCCPMMLFTS